MYIYIKQKKNTPCRPPPFHRAVSFRAMLDPERRPMLGVRPRSGSSPWPLPAVGSGRFFCCFFGFVCFLVGFCFFRLFDIVWLFVDKSCYLLGGSMISCFFVLIDIICDVDVDIDVDVGVDVVLVLALLVLVLVVVVIIRGWWSVVVGCFLVFAMVVVCWLLVGSCLLVCCGLLVVGCRLLVACLLVVILVNGEWKLVVGACCGLVVVLALVLVLVSLGGSFWYSLSVRPAIYSLRSCSGNVGVCAISWSFCVLVVLLRNLWPLCPEFWFLKYFCTAVLLNYF